MTRASLAIAALLAVILFWRTRNERQGKIAAGLALLLALDVARLFLRPWPVLFVAGFVLWYAVTTWIVGAVSGPRGALFAAPFVPLVLLSGEAYRDKMTAPLARAVFALSLAAQLLAALRIVSHSARPDDGQRVALVLAASSLADFASLWIIGQPHRDWYVGQAISIATWIVIASIQARALVRDRVKR